jgi:hypothetical protein
MFLLRFPAPTLFANPSLPAAEWIGKIVLTWLQFLFVHSVGFQKHAHHD